MKCCCTHRYDRAGASRRLARWRPLISRMCRVSRRPLYYLIRSHPQRRNGLFGSSLSRDTDDFAAERAIEHERAERNNRGYEREQGTAEGPGPRDADPKQGQHERNEEDSVDAADNANGERQANDVLQRHCNKEQGEKRRALNERDETKLTKCSQYRIISASA